ncbi:hypothetical protein MKZ38_005701 [Zalerion maritima]|uniref:Uncharacterized protein n=1 Tax=Zalerion maritima TaxID=339359 RepID=A0AAD5RJX5_9PEZI|nr:hypothetical protein MKZ38_005701 [Zalerion maritima]
MSSTARLSAPQILCFLLASAATSVRAQDWAATTATGDTSPTSTPLSDASQTTSSGSSPPSDSCSNNAITGAGIGVGFGIGVGSCLIVAAVLWATLWMRKREELDTPPPPGTSPYLEVIEEGRAGLGPKRPSSAAVDGRASRMSTRLSFMGQARGNRHVSWWLVGQ